LQQKKDRELRFFQDMDTFASIESAADAPDDPLDLFGKWLIDAESTEPNDPNAMALATIDADGRPSVRMVLLKDFDTAGFVFYTNRESRKGLALAAHPVAAVCFHWKSLRRQVRIEGTIEWVSDAESDEYYNTRAVGSRLGAWASDQSHPLDSRTILANKVAALEQEYAGREDSIPRPDHWGGYRLKPDSIEFWHDGAFRLHRRVTYKPAAGGLWTRQMLYP
jgi:pyridoxamine 5'-phosphate oxidase